ncbi:hypothetical protein DFH07DRAFT_768541 [Mycena maculata]|uniref:Uncharacterized protein n=1 Tax=Mycena maculata TaxID=230809 RepID=A0AAD7JSZ4_9AGAR|nr:hypothetical protein DFH07DRAFT_768541 [Mycena maculata]
MPPSNENAPAAASTAQGSNSQRQKSKPKPGARGGRSKSKMAPATELEAHLAEIARLKEELALAHATNKGHQQRAAREAPGGGTKGFVLKVAMGLEDGPEEFSKIQSTLHTNVIRANLNVEEHYRHQDPAKLAAAYKLTRKQFPYLTEKRFPLNWALAEMAKQYLGNKRKYGVKCGVIPNAKERKHKAEENTVLGRSKRRRTELGSVPHIDDASEDVDEEENSNNEEDDH